MEGELQSILNEIPLSSFQKNSSDLLYVRNYEKHHFYKIFGFVKSPSDSDICKPSSDDSSSGYPPKKVKKSHINYPIFSIASSIYSCRVFECWLMSYEFPG